MSAIRTANIALEVDPAKTLFKVNLAHGLLFNNQFAKALTLYMKNKDTTLPDQGNMTFEEIVLDDFKQFRKKGITHPDMAKIEKLLRDAVPRKP